MADDPEPTGPQAPPFEDNFHVLAGWTGSNLGQRMVLKLQGVQAGRPDEPNKVHQLEFLLTKEQAAQLGQFLFHASGQTPPRRRTAWLDKLLDR